MFLAYYNEKIADRAKGRPGYRAPKAEGVRALLKASTVKSGA